MYVFIEGIHFQSMERIVFQELGYLRFRVAVSKSLPGRSHKKGAQIISEQKTLGS